MTCDNARMLLTAYVDSELDVAHSLEIEGHLSTCVACARIVENQQRLRSAIQSSSLSYEPSDSLEGRIQSALRAAAPSSQTIEEQRSSNGTGSRRAGLRWQWIAVAAAILLAIVVAGRIPIGRTPASGDLVAQEILDSHLRSLMPGHLTDVESSDRHTVKPWFDGKIEFSPPVDDFAPQGFPLAGGRLDSISGQTVAVLVYKRNKHLINVYVWPSTAPAAAPASTASQGYNIIHWTQAGSTWWMISDLNLEELQQLEGFLRGGAH